MSASTADAVRSGPAGPLLDRITALLQAGKAEQAVALLDAMARASPLDPDLHLLLGKTLLRLGRTDLALAALREALGLRPGHAETLSGLGSALLSTRDAAGALRCSATAFALAPGHDTAVNLSRVLLKTGDYERALAVTARALDWGPGSLLARKNQALALEGLGRYDDAIQAWRGIVAAASGDVDACHSLATLLLQTGAMTPQTWAMYERRLDWRGLPHGISRWTGGDLAGRTVLLHAEQGFGDTLQFVRYAPLVAARGARVVLAVPPTLLRLLASTPGVHESVALGGALPPFDLFCPLLSLPALFGTTLDSIPPPLPYGDPVPRNGSAPLQVGLAWSGNPGFVHDDQRSIPPTLLKSLGGLPGIRLHSLQFGCDAAPRGLEIITLMDGVVDFADTAARIATLDLVIAVDTAVAHLAGTMGKPVWLLSRFRGCWRWMNDRADSPWYPTMRILRQPDPNDWHGVLAQVRRDLAELGQATLRASGPAEAVAAIRSGMEVGARSG